MPASPLFRYSDAQIRDMLHVAVSRAGGRDRWADAYGVPRDQVQCALDGVAITDAIATALRVKRIQTKRERVLAIARVKPDVDHIFKVLGRTEPKSSIRAYFSVASDRGEIGDGWRVRRRRRPSRRAGGYAGG